VAKQRDRGLDPALKRLIELVDRARVGLSALTDRELVELTRLYRYSATRLSLYETQGRSPELVAQVAALTARAHALLHGSHTARKDPWWRRFFLFFAEEVPRAIRGEWRLIAASFAIVYGIAAIAWIAVARDIDNAWSLLDPSMVANEIEQLESLEPGEAFRGNFTFGLGESAGTSSWIMSHNMFVGVIFFAAALIPPVYVLLLATNGLMLGTYTGVAGHYGQAGNISSILWCHGTLEIQALVLAGAAGLVLVRAWIAPGAWTRRHALRVEAARSWRLLAPVFPLLFFAGLIEGFVSPHAPLQVRLAVAVTSGLAMVGWAAFSGRRPHPE
jgi:uncharacterized membrane protein SpoIIM required for sporulation